MNKNNIKLEDIKKQREIIINSRVSYFVELVKVAVDLRNQMTNDSDEQAKLIKLMLIEETIDMMTSSWRNTLPFNLFVSKKADEFAKSLGVSDIRNHDYSLKFGMDDIISQIEEVDFLAVAENLNDQDLAKLNKALNKGDKALNSNVMLQWEHAYTGKMFTNDVTVLINELSDNKASESDILTAVSTLVHKQAIVWILKTETYELTTKGYKDVRKPDWESAFKDSDIELSDSSKEDYNNAFGKEW